jgi:gas vesicle protein
MSNNNKTLIGLGLGLIAGGIAGYYLASDDGKKMRKQVKKQISKIDAEMRQTLQTQADTISSKLSEVAENTQSIVNDLSETAKSKLNSFSNTAEDAVDDAQSSFEQGMDTAKKKMHKEKEKIAAIVENGQA